MQARHQFTETDYLPVTGWPNHPAAGNAALGVRSHIGHHGSGVPKPGRLPVNSTEEQHRQTLRMSLALSATRRWFIAHLCTERRAYSARDGGQHAPRPLVAAQYGLSGRLRPPGKPGGWSRPDFGLLCYHSLRRPAAHKLLFPLVLAQFPAYGVFCALAWRKGRGIWATMWILMTHLAVGATASLLCR